MIQDSRGGYSYQADGYHINVENSDDALWAKTSDRFSDTTTYVNARPVQSGRDGYYGVLCRIVDEENFYYFILQANGEYTIGKYKN
jgi:hypothetical protein